MVGYGLLKTPMNTTDMIYLSIYLSVYLSIYLSIYLSAMIYIHVYTQNIKHIYIYTYVCMIKPSDWRYCTDLTMEVRVRLSSNDLETRKRWGSSSFFPGHPWATLLWLGYMEYSTMAVHVDRSYRVLCVLRLSYGALFLGRHDVWGFNHGCSMDWFCKGRSIHWSTHHLLVKFSSVLLFEQQGPRAVSRGLKRLDG